MLETKHVLAKDGDLLVAAPPACTYPKLAFLALTKMLSSAFALLLFSLTLPPRHNRAGGVFRDVCLSSS